MVETNSALDSLMQHYEKWRNISLRAGEPPPDPPAHENNRLYFRRGYPHDGWTGYIIEPRDNGYDVRWVTTERQVEPAEYQRAYFSNLEEAGKYIVWDFGESVRMHCRLQPITQIWLEEGLDTRVKKTDLPDGQARYSLKRNPNVFFESHGGGIKPENHLLPLTYNELDTILTAGLPESVVVES